MNQLIKKLLATVLSMTIVLSITACSPPEVGGEEDDPFANQQIDTSKTQLFINNFYGGYGADWLAAAKARYEELHKDDVYEEGKKGVQIFINNQKVSASSVASTILDNRDEIYFTEGSFYRTLKSDGVLADITEAVKGDLEPYGDPAGSTIEKKLTAQQKEFYGIEENGETHYYGLPHYSGYMGITYNVDLFDEKGYYFVDGYQTQTGDRKFQGTRYKDKAKSVGLDGKAGTDDDGLPTTYEEFKELVGYIQRGGDTAISWNGADLAYLTYFLQALVTDYEGADRMLLNYNFGSSRVKADDLGKIVDGEFVADAEPTTLTAETGYETARQRGKYEGLKFLSWLVDKNNDKYHGQWNFNSSYSHINAQEDYLLAGHDGGVTAPIAMLIDGIWWENEASSTFSRMVSSYGQEYSKASRRFAFMPLPKATAGKAAAAAESGKPMTLLDFMYSICFMKANIAAWKKPLALDFIKFVHTDVSLVEYTTYTNTPKAFNYTMTQSQLDKLSHFGRSVMKLKKQSDVIFPFSAQSKYVLNQSSFVTDAMYAISATKSTPAAEMRDNKTTAEDYFTKMYTYYRDGWDSKA